MEDESLALRLLEAALRDAGRSSLPADPVAMHGFVRAHLVAPLTARIGPHLVAAFLEELALEAEHAAPSTSSPSIRPVSPEQRPRRTSSAGALGPPPSSGASTPPSSPRPGVGHTVLLLDGDRFRRATTSRALVSAGFDVIAIDTEDDLRALASGCDAIVATLGAATQPALIAAAARALPRARALLRTDDADGARRAFADLRERLHVAPISAPTVELIESVRRASIG